jgi:SAM-dependent methyltransferase
MNDVAGALNAPGDGTGKAARYYKKDFWRTENRRYTEPHYRLEKSSRIVNKLARGRNCSLLDVGCGPATLQRLLSPNIAYFGIDIAIHDASSNLLELDFLEAPIRFDDRKFDLVVAQGVFEYIGEFQDQKFAEIAQLLAPAGAFIVSYVNFGHRARNIYWPYSNILSFDDFRSSLGRHFTIRRYFPTSHNWNHNEPGRKLLKAANMRLNVNVPLISPVLAVEYFFICSLRRPRVLPAGA